MPSPEPLPPVACLLPLPARCVHIQRLRYERRRGGLCMLRGAALEGPGSGLGLVVALLGLVLLVALLTAVLLLLAVPHQRGGYAARVVAHSFATGHR